MATDAIAGFYMAPPKSSFFQENSYQRAWEIGAWHLQSRMCQSVNKDASGFAARGRIPE